MLFPKYYWYDLRERECIIILLPILGTLLAILTTFITYIGYGLVIGAVTVPNASGNETEYNAWLYGNASAEIPLFTDCSLDTLRNNESFTCEFGSANDQQVRAIYFASSNKINYPPEIQ